MINEFWIRSWRRSIFFTLKHSLNFKERFNVLVLNSKLPVKLLTTRQSVPLSKDWSSHPFFFLYLELSYEFCYLKLHFNLWFFEYWNTHSLKQAVVCGLFEDAVYATERIAFYRMLVSKQSIWNHVDGIGCGRIGVVPHVCLERLRKP